MMRHFILNLIFFVISSFLLTACCTKKDCDIEERPEISIKYESTYSPDKLEVKIFYTEKDSYKIIDSTLKYVYDGNSTIYFAGYSFEDRIELKNYSYILKTDYTQDTIYNINYDRSTREKKCNSCFPPGLGLGNAEEIRITNFSYQSEKRDYSGNDTLVINLPVIDPEDF